MRLLPEEIEKIKLIVLRYVPSSKVYIFGSRVDSNAKGGDIDILILDDSKVELNNKINILTDLNIEIGEQKYDVVTYTYDDDNAFKQHILQNAVAI